MNALPNDFVEFLRFLDEAEVEYLIVGGYAVGYYGYPRTTADMDIWVAVSPANANKLVHVFRRFGMSDESITPSIFLQDNSIIRMGLPPVRIEVLTGIDGVEFAECYRSRTVANLGDQPVNLISLRHLLVYKRASGCHKDLDDIEHLRREDCQSPLRSSLHFSYQQRSKIILHRRFDETFRRFGALDESLNIESHGQPR